MWLSDKIFAVREQTLSIVRDVAKEFGSKWLVEKIMPDIVKLADDPSYMNRMTPLFSMKVFAPELTLDEIKQFYLPVLDKLSKD